MKAPPKLHQHHRGQFFVKYAGQRHWLGSDKKVAQIEYADHLRRWGEWKSKKAETRVRVLPGGPKRIVDVYDAFIDQRRACVTSYTTVFYEGSLRRFIAVYGRYPADMVRVGEILAFRSDLLSMGLARKTVNHEIGAIKTLMQWGAGMEFMPALPLQAIKALSLPPVPKKGYKLADVRKMMAKAEDKLKPWIAVNWLTMARPMEMVRLVAREGVFESKGVFRFNESKTSTRSGEPRHLVLSDLALKWLGKSEPLYSRLDSYSRSVRRACGAGGPHPLRHGAASHLHSLGVDRVTVDLILGHLPSRVSRSYVPIDWPALRPTVSRLTL